MENYWVFSHYELRYYWDNERGMYISYQHPIYYWDYDAEEADLEAERLDYKEQTWD
jgi:hypothetical protein